MILCSLGKLCFVFSRKQQSGDLVTLVVWRAVFTDSLELEIELLVSG